MKGTFSVVAVAVFLCAGSAFAIPAGHTLQEEVKAGDVENVDNETNIIIQENQEKNETRVGFHICKNGSRVPITRGTWDRLHELCGEDEEQCIGCIRE